MRIVFIIIVRCVFMTEMLKVLSFWTFCPSNFSHHYLKAFRLHPLKRWWSLLWDVCSVNCCFILHYPLHNVGNSPRGLTPRDPKISGVLFIYLFGNLMNSKFGGIYITKCQLKQALQLFRVLLHVVWRLIILYGAFFEIKLKTQELTDTEKKKKIRQGSVSIRLFWAYNEFASLGSGRQKGTSVFGDGLTAVSFIVVWASPYFSFLFQTLVLFIDPSSRFQAEFEPLTLIHWSDDPTILGLFTNPSKCFKVF